MSDKLFDLAVRQCHRIAQSHTTTPARLAARTFTTTPSRQKHGDIPTFSTSLSTPSDLVHLLSLIRNRIFLPAHLRSAQRNLIFKQRHRALLTSEPLHVEVGSETVQLEPLDMTKDIPDSWGSVVRAMSLMGTSRADWNNLLSLLEGMKNAGRKWRTWQVEKIVRDAGKAGMSGVIVECVRAAARTGLVLRDVRVVREAMWACRMRAVLSGWSKGETERALRNAEQLAELLEGKLHLGGKRPEGLDPRREADVLGAVCELAVVRAVRHLGGEDVDGKVERYVRRLVDNLRGVGEEVAMEVQDKKDGLKTPWAATADYELMRWVPVRNALKMAPEVLGGKITQQDLVNDKLKHLDSILADGRDVVTGAQGDKREKRRGLNWLEESS